MIFLEYLFHFLAMSTQVMNVINVINVIPHFSFRLPDSSIKMEVSESSAVEELANYPQEKLKELLTTNKSGFRQR